MMWISIKPNGRLPAQMEEVLITDSTFVYMGYPMISEEGVRWYSSCDDYIENVTHWMPLPELPKKLDV